MANVIVKSSQCLGRPLSVSGGGSLALGSHGFL